MMNPNQFLLYVGFVFIYGCYLPNSKANFVELSQAFTINLISHHFQNCKLVFLTITPEVNPIPAAHLDFQSFILTNSHFVSGHVIPNFNFNAYNKSARSNDWIKYNHANCALAALYILEYMTKLNRLSAWLTATTTSAFMPLLKKDEDHFVFLCALSITCDQILLYPTVGQKIKYKISVVPTKNTQDIKIKSVSLYGGFKGAPILISIDPAFFELTTLFPDTTYNFNGKLFRVSNPRSKTYFDEENNRGLYRNWFKVMMLKLNFTCIVFESSLSGGSGKRFSNGTWAGTVGDVVNGHADLGAFVGNMYGRHGVVGFSTTITYEWMFFVTRKPKKVYSSTAIFRPLSVPLWIGFFIAILFVIVALKIILKNDSRNLIPRISYLFASLLEQDSKSYLNLEETPIRVLVACWLCFSIVFSTVYRGKLVTLIGFPILSWIPGTYKLLAYSNYSIGLHVIGKGGAADVIFSSSDDNVLKILNSRVEYYSEVAKCLQEALKKEMACVLWKCHFEYTLHAEFTETIGGNPFQTSKETSNFLHDGFVSKFIY